MKRLLRWAFNLAAALSALLFVGVLVLWARSYGPPSGYDHVGGGTTRGDWTLASARGGLRWQFNFAARLPPAGPGVSRLSLSVARSNPFPGVTREDDSVVYTPPGGATVSLPSKRTVVVGDALPLLACVLFLVPATIVLARLRQRSRWIRGGCCASCGYDLRATPNRCPECGAVPRQAPAPAK